jgi:hypothetical protein
MVWVRCTIYHGYGVPQDFKEALKWYRLAATRRNLDAQLNVGSMYYEGEGVAEDLAHSFMWLTDFSHPSLATRNFRSISVGIRGSPKSIQNFV